MTESSVTSRLPADLVARGTYRRNRLAVYDPVVAPREDGHLAGLRSVMQAFADIRAVEEILCPT